MVNENFQLSSWSKNLKIKNFQGTVNIRKSSKILSLKFCILENKFSNTTLFDVTIVFCIKFDTASKMEHHCIAS